MESCLARALVEEMNIVSRGIVSVEILLTDNDSTLKSCFRFPENSGKLRDGLFEPKILVNPSHRVKVMIKGILSLVISTKILIMWNISTTLGCANILSFILYDTTQMILNFLKTWWPLWSTYLVIASFVMPIGTEIKKSMWELIKGSNRRLKKVSDSPILVKSIPWNTQH